MADHPEPWSSPFTQVELRGLWTYSDGALTVKGYRLPGGTARGGSWVLADQATGNVQGVVPPGEFSRRFRPVDARVAALGVIGMCNWVAWWFRPGRDGIDAVADQLADMAVAAVQRADHRTPDGEGPAAALKMLRQDIDHLERLLDL